jgi:hypothetical protein
MQKAAGGPLRPKNGRQQSEMLMGPFGKYHCPQLHRTAQPGRDVTARMPQELTRRSRQTLDEVMGELR